MNKYERRSIRSYQKKADHYDDSPEGRYTREFKVFLLAAVALSDGDRMLDIACGNGRLLQMMSERHTFSGYGADISQKMVDCAERLNPTMAFVRAGCDALPFDDGFFDVATVCAAFHHFPDVARFAKEAHRVLKPNGMLYVAEIYYPAFVRTFLNPFVKLSPDGDVKFYAPEEIIALFESAGFHLEKFQKEGHIQLIGVRKL